jgi:two-component system response regulator YesN
MYKMVIVDDEKVVLDGLTSAINWSDHQVQIVGTSLDGNTAYQLIEDTKPHIVMADIRMPGLNGLDLIDKVKTLRPDTVFIVISGYTEFDYAKRALKLEVVDYLTKPIELDEIIASVKKAINKFDSIQVEKQNKDKIQKYELQLEEKYMLDAIFGHQLSDHELTTEFENCTVLVCGFTSSKGLTKYKERDFIRHLKKPFQKNGDNGFVFFVDEYLVVVFSKSNQEENKAVVDFSELVVNQVGELPIIGVGNTYDDLTGVQQSYKEAVEVFHIGIYLNRSFTYYDALEKVDHNVGSDMIKTIDNYFNKQNWDLNNLNKLIDDLLQYSQQKMLPPVKTKYMCFRLIINVFDYVQQEYEVNVEHILEEKHVIYNQLHQLRSIEEMKEWLLDKGSLLSEYLQDNQMSQKEKLIVDVKKYIENHFCEVITLDDIAQQFHISPAYLSSLFSKRVGMTLFEFIIDMRMNTAKERLRTTNYKISEICHQVGYDNQRYFNQVFKKHVGTTPGKYRSEHLIRQ